MIVGLASFGKAVYEKAYNSGIGSNGFSRARHLLLNHEYAKKYPETFSATIPDELIFQGPYALDDLLPNANGMTVGEALLSPTRTYLPVMNELLGKHRKDMWGQVISLTPIMQRNLYAWVPKKFFPAFYRLSNSLNEKALVISSTWVDPSEEGGAWIFRNETLPNDPTGRTVHTWDGKEIQVQTLPKGFTEAVLFRE